MSTKQRREFRLRTMAGMSQMELAVRAKSSTHAVRLAERGGLQAISHVAIRERFAAIYNELEASAQPNQTT